MSEYLIYNHLVSFFCYTVLCFSCAIKRNTCVKIGAIKHNVLCMISSGNLKQNLIIKTKVK